MRFLHCGARIDFEMGLGPKPVSKRKKVRVWMLRVLPMAPSTLKVFALEKEVLDSPYKGIFPMYMTSSDDGCSGVLPKFLTCDNAERSDLNDTSCQRLLAAELTVRTASKSNFSTGIPRCRRLRFRALHIYLLCGLL